MAGDPLRIDLVRLDPRPGVRLVVARPLERRLGVADLDLEALAGARLLGDRAERLERVGLLLDLEGGRPTQRREALGRLLAYEAFELRLELGDPLDVGVLAGEEVLR